MTGYDNLAIAALFLIGLILVGFVAVVLVSLCFIFKKANQKPWKALIPFYSTYVQCKFSWNLFGFVSIMIVQIGYIVLKFILRWGTLDDIPIIYNIFSVLSTIFGFLYIVFNFLVNVKLSWSFGHGIIFALGLTFLPFIFLPILAFGKSEYKEANVCKLNKFGF